MFQSFPHQVSPPIEIIGFSHNILSKTSKINWQDSYFLWVIYSKCEPFQTCVISLLDKVGQRFILVFLKELIIDIKMNKR